MSKMEDLRGESDEELTLKLETLRKEIFDLRGQRLDSQTQKTHLIGERRKDVARILTIKAEREKK